MKQQEGGNNFSKINENEIGRLIVSTALKMNKKLGPGLVVSIYETILFHELKKFGLNVKQQLPIPLTYNGLVFKKGFTIGLLVEDKVIVELKSLDEINDIHKKQLLTYLRLTRCKLGFLMNFNNLIIKGGIIRIINGVIE